MRTFIAIELPPTIKQHLCDIARQLRRSDVAATWVKPDNLHLTLRFLGNVDDILLPQLAEQIAQLTKQQTAFHADLDGFGFFPSLKCPRILFAAIQEPQPFRHLAQHLDRLLEPLGFAPEQHFHPHITLARIKSNKNLEQLHQLTDDLQPQSPFTVNTISLYGSILHADGAHYHLLQRGLLLNSSGEPPTQQKNR